MPSLWKAEVRGHGVMDRVFTFPPGFIDRHKTVLANICEVSQPQGEPLDFPFQGSSTMQIYDVVPLDNGSLSLRLGNDWDSDLNMRIRFVVFESVR